MAEIRCLNCGLKIKVRDLLSTRCPRCGEQIPEGCYGCSGNCLACTEQKKER